MLNLYYSISEVFQIKILGLADSELAKGYFCRGKPKILVLKTIASFKASFVSTGPLTADGKSSVIRESFPRSPLEG